MALIKPEDLKEAIEFVRSEKNLLAIGYFGAHDRRLKNESSTRKVELDALDSHVQREVIIQSPEFLGLPNTADLDKYFAFMKIVMEERARIGYIPEKINLSAYRLLSELGLSDSGQNYEDVATWGNRMVATTIHSKSGLYYASVKDYVDDTTHVFRSFKRIKREKAKKNGGESETRRVETYEITLEDWVIDNLNEAYMVPVDFQAYKKLRRPIAKAIFHLLHLWFFASGGKPVEKEYGSLCQRLNIRKYPYETKIRASIGQALDDLEKLGYLKSWSLEKMLTKRDAFKVVMEAGPALIQSLDQNRRRALPGTEEEVEGETAALIAGRLRRLGVSKAKIESYVAQPEEILAQLVDKIEYIDHLLSNKKSGIKNPGGFTVHFIDTGEAIPETFITKRQRQKAQLELKNKLMREAQNTAFYQAYEEWKQERIDRYIDTNFKPEEFDQLLKEKLPLVYEQHPNVRRMQMAERIRQARVFVRREIGETINLPTFEEWVKTKEVDEIEDIMQPLLFQ